MPASVRFLDIVTGTCPKRGQHIRFKFYPLYLSLLQCVMTKTLISFVHFQFLRIRKDPTSSMAIGSSRLQGITVWLEPRWSTIVDMGKRAPANACMPRGPLTSVWSYRWVVWYWINIKPMSLWPTDTSIHWCRYINSVNFKPFRAIDFTIYIFWLWWLISLGLVIMSHSK